jgi:FkbM family methyltransferase
VKRINGFWWPDDVGEKWQHSFKHVRSLDWAMHRSRRRRMAVQAGGNIGLWPRTLAGLFSQVITFEPDTVSRACLKQNVVGLRNVNVMSDALGAEAGRCSIEHRSLGSHRVTEGDDVNIVTLDSLGLLDVDFLQLDVEGYEWHALVGAHETLSRCRPLVQVELRDFGEHYGASDKSVRDLLYSFGYQQVSAQPGNDFVFEAPAGEQVA